MVGFRVTRFVIENTIEERILKLQEKKQLVFEGYNTFFGHSWLFSVNDALSMLHVVLLSNLNK